MNRNLFVNIAAAFLGTALIVTCANLSWVQIGYWRDSETLWAHTLAVTVNNAVGQNNYGKTIEYKGEMEAAVHHYEEAVQFKPNYADGHENLGLARARQGDLQDAVHHLYLAVHFDPRHEEWHYYLRSALQQ